jgi:hypothetical protein
MLQFICSSYVLQLLWTALLSLSFPYIRFRYTCACINHSNFYYLRRFALQQDLQFIATNLHTQVWSVSGSSSSDNTQATSPTATANSKTGISHYDFTTTGAPAGTSHI